MPHQVCPRCQRANPGEAVYCWFDGIVLHQGPGPGGPAPGQLLHEFVFPSGRRCRTFDELVQGCQYEWEDARDMLRRGDFSQFLSGVGRLDLARAAREAQAQTDPDIALHNFVGNLPAGQVQGPRLDLHPRRLQLRAVHAGEQRQVRLTVTNLGKGLLQGKLSVTEGGEWLKLANGGGGNGQCALKAARDQQVTLQIDARGLAAPQSYSGKLTVITNGGIAEVPVRLDVTGVPFLRPPYQAASTPREMAEKMRANPKPAVALLEAGEVARWFAANGWTYPVQGATAKGVAAVQQFFEGMGLSKPPPVQLSEEEFRLECVPPEVQRRQVALRTAAKKWVYAHVDSDKPWLKVTTPSVSGPQQAQIAFEIDSSLMDAGKVHEGLLRIEANAGQKLSARVWVVVPRTHEPFTRRLLRPFFTGALLALVVRLLLALPADLYARLLGAPAAVAWSGDHATTGWSQAPSLEEGFLRQFVLATWWLGGVVGLGYVWRKGGNGADLFCAAVAGCVAGAMAAASLGALLVPLDALPRTVMAKLAGVLPASRWGDAAVWVAVASACWAVVGGGIGFLLCSLGPGGARLLGSLAAPLARLCRVCGMKRAADLFVPEG
jgi:hypothetical protein